MRAVPHCDLFDDVESYAFTPQIQQPVEHRSRSAVADRETIDLCDWCKAVRRAGKKCFGCVDDIVDLEISFNKRNAQLVTQLSDRRYTDARQDVTPTRADDFIPGIDQEI